MADFLLASLKKVRENAETEFHKLFIAENIAEEIGSEIKFPRLAKHQMQRKLSE